MIARKESLVNPGNSITNLVPKRGTEEKRKFECGSRKRNTMAVTGKLRKKRGTVRTSLTKLIAKIDAVLAEERPNVDIIEEYWDILREKENLLDELDRDIEAGTEEDHLEEETESVMNYKDNTAVRKTRMRRHGVQLPKLVIEKFSGDISLWQTFWGQFETAIHNNPDLSKAEKFNYLQTYLSGAATNVIAGLALTDANYDSAIKMLINRFGGKDLVKRNLLSPPRILPRFSTIVPRLTLQY